MNMPESGIYRITNKINLKCYVGCSIDIKKRFSKHISGKKSVIHNAIVKYGVDNFIFEILHICPKSDFDYMEKYEIHNNNCVVPYGYNSTTGGYNGYDFSNASREKMSKSQTGKKHSEITKLRMIASRSGENNSSFGKPKSKDTKLKISNALKGRFGGADNPFAKRVSYEGTTYGSVKDLAQHLGMSGSLLRYYRRKKKIIYEDIIDENN